MKKTVKIVLLFLGVHSLVFAQTPQRIYDLKSLTDSAGTVHLFYRIYAPYESTEYRTANIYHLNTQTGQDTLFLEDYYDTRFGYPSGATISDYKFLDSDPRNYVFITTYCDDECSVTISRPDSADMMGGLFVTMDHLNVEGPDSGRVYVEMEGEVIIGLNGGRDWPDADAENFEEIPDSSKLGFPLTSLSPYNDSLMFGIDIESDSIGFYRSLDKGKKIKFISDTLFGTGIQYDADKSTIYALDVLNIPGNESGKNCSIDPCKYGVWVNKLLGVRDFWELKKIFNVKINSPSYPTIVAHPKQSGKLYVWNADSVLVTEDFGETFDVLLNPTEEITGFSVGHTKEYYTTTSKLYSHKNGNSVELFSIPVSNERHSEIPKQNKLLQNYPNPFNPTTNIRFTLAHSSQVSLVVYDMLGRKIATLINETLPAGEQTVRFDASGLANGMYLYKLRTANQEFTRKMTLIK